MTRDEIVAEAARRLGDESADFKTQVAATFDFVLADLAAHEAIAPLQQLATSATLVQSQRDYTSLALTGQASPAYPYEILSLRVWAFGTEALLQRVPDANFELLRARDGDDYEARPRWWRPYPNMRTIQLHPLPDATSDGETIEVLYTVPPTAIAGGDELVQVQPEDVETIVYGLKARMAPFLDETVADAQGDYQLYLAGRQRMWGRRWNNYVGSIQPVQE